MKKGKNYFDEQYMISKLNNYYNNNSEKDLNDLSLKCIDIIHGMINKEFSYNSIVLKNRDDYVQDCMFEILKYVNKRYYNPEKGRLFAYINRIIKNTLLKKYQNGKRIIESETNIHYDEIENEELMDYVVNKYDNIFDNINNSVKINKKDSIMYIYYIIKNIISNIDNINDNNISNLINIIKYNDKYEINNLNEKYIKYILINIKDILLDVNNDISEKYDISEDINIYSNFKLSYYPFSFVKKLKKNIKYKNFVNENNKNDVINLILFLGYYYE